MEWQPIETAPPNEMVFLHGYTICGGSSSSGPYKRWRSTLGEVDEWGLLVTDSLEPGCDCIRGGEMQVTHWAPLQWPTHPAQATNAATPCD